MGVLACGTGGCERVQASRWSEFLGLPVAAYGVAGYLGLFVLGLASVQERWLDSPAPMRLVAAASGAGVAFTAWLTYLELFVIHAICYYCVASAAIITALFLVSLLSLRTRPSASPPPPGPPGS